MTSEIKQRTVYKLVRTDKPEDGTDVYVGSTSQDLRVRLNEHRHDAGRCNTKLYTRMSEVGIYNWKILPLLVHICDQKTIKAFEGNWIDILNADLNSYLPLRENNIKAREQAKSYRRVSLETKRYYCDVCDMAFCHIFNLKRHLKSLKHSYAYMNSVD